MTGKDGKGKGKGLHTDREHRSFNACRRKDQREFKEQVINKLPNEFKQQELDWNPNQINYEI